jgi:PAS domain S-box-containing protein
MAIETHPKSHGDNRRDIIVIGFGATLAVLLAGGLFGYVNAQRLVANSRMVAHTHEVIEQLEAVLSTLKDAETGQRGYLLTEDPKYLQPYDDAVARVQTELSQIKELTADNPVQQSRLAELDDKVGAKLDELHQTVALMKSGDRAAALKIVHSDIGKTLMDNARQDIAAMQQIERDLLRQREDESARSSGATFLSILLTALIGCVLVALLFYFSRRHASERERSARILAEQKERLRVKLASIGDAVISADTDTRVTFMNPTAEKLTGWTVQDGVGKPLHELFNIVNEETRNPVESPVIKAIREGVVVGLANHTLLIAKDGVERPIDDSAAPMRDEEGKVFGVVLVFHDITERRTAEKRMYSSETRYRRLFEAAHDGVLIIDMPTFKIADVNPFVLDLLDYPREYFIGKEPWELGVFRDRQSGQDAMETLQKNGAARYDGLSLQDRNGRHHPVEIVANVYQEDNQPVIQFNVRDISDRKRFEDERQAHLHNEQSLRMEAEAANRAKDIFLATLSHEMRTPLNAIVGWMAILRKEGCSENELQEGLNVIERNTRAQVQLIEDVLDVSRIVSGKLRLDLRPCELIDAINAGIDVVRPAAEARGIAMDIELDPSASRATADVGRIQQVVWNLLSNAIKFTPKGGTIGVTLAREQSSLQIQVVDNGQGMSAELLPYVFDRFRQADGSTRRRFGGLGLGLSIVKHIVEMHGGTVQAQSGGVGKGSTFTVLLPVRALRVDEVPIDSSPVEGGLTEGFAREAGSPPLVRLDGLRLLAVDDEADARRLLEKVLGEAGAIVTTASSVAEATEVLAKLRPDVLISDLGMPEQDGFDLIRRVRGSGHHPRDLPAVALTAFAHKDDARRALLAGFQVHVPKPVDPHDLTAVIASLAGRTG